MLSGLESYHWSVLCLGLTGALSLVQLLIFDLMAIKLKHPPGHPIEANHNNPLFRLSRAHANTNETIGALILVCLFAMFSGANAQWVNICMGVYLIARLGHMLCYYAGWSTLRGVVFGISLLPMFGLFILGLLAWV